MDWRLAMEAERAALKRVVALLFALADLAELAGGRSQAVRSLVLWILRPAEAVARNLVTGSPGQIPLCRGGNSPADAIHLASSLRSLAAAFLGLSRGAFLCANDADCLPGGRVGVLIPYIPRRICALATALVEANSTALRVWRRRPYDSS